MKRRLKAPKKRNHLVPLAKFRKAGKHEKSEKAKRKRLNQTQHDVE